MTLPKQIACVELRLRPSVRQIASATRLLADVCGVLTAEDSTSRIVLAAHELLENLAKYALDECPSFTLTVSEGPHGGEVRIETKNLADPAHISELEALLAALGDSADPREVYRELMVVSAARREGSGLGLARIRVEAEMTLVHRVEANQLCLVACGSLPLNPRP